MASDATHFRASPETRPELGPASRVRLRAWSPRVLYPAYNDRRHIQYVLLSMYMYMYIIPSSTMFAAIIYMLSRYLLTAPAMLPRPLQ